MYSFDDTNQQLTFGDTSPVPTDQATAQRAVKADYALGGAQGGSPGAMKIAQNIQSGAEGQYRQDIANTDTLKAEQARMNLLLKMSQNGNPTSEDIQTAQAMTGLDLKEDPDTILEKKFAGRYTGETLGVNADNTQSVYNKFGYFDPVKSSNDVDVYHNTLLANEYEKTQLENLHGEWQNTGWGSAIAQYAEQMVPLLSAYRLSNVLQGAPTTSILPGTNLGEQISYLKALPLAERKTAYDAALKDLKAKSTLDAMTFAQAVVSFNATDSFLSNAMGVADAAGIASTLGKGLVKIGGKLVRQNIPVVSSAAELEKHGPELPKLVDYTMDTIQNLPGEKQGPRLPGLVDYALGAVQDMQREAGIREASKKTYYIPEGAAKKLEAVEVNDGGVKSFKSGDLDLEPADNIHYATPEEAKRLAGDPGKVRIVTMQDGAVARSVKQPDGQWSIPFDSQKVYLSSKPEVGKVPVEFFDTQNRMGTVVHDTVHTYDPITEVTKHGPEPTFYTDVKNRVSVQVAKDGGEGMVPVDVYADKTVKFNPTIKGTTYYIPEAAAKNFDGLKVSGGKPTFYTDLENGVSVEHSLKPQPGFVPVEVSSDGSHVKFSNVIQQEAEDFRTALKDAAKAVSDTTLKPADVAATMGDTTKAINVTANSNIMNAAKASDLPEVLKTLPSSHNPSNMLGKGAAIVREAARRVTADITTKNAQLMSMVTSVNVPRGTAEAVAAGVRETEVRFRSEYGGRLNDAIVDFVHIPPELNPAGHNLDTVIMRVGQPNGHLFDSRAMAEQYRELYGINGEVKQQGASFYIGVQKYVDETSQVYRDALLTKDNTTPVSLTNMLLNRFRSADDLVSPVQRNNRKVATFAAGPLQKAVREQSEETSLKLTRKQRDEVETVLAVNRDAENPVTGRRGEFYTSQADFENSFLNKIGHLPTQDQTAHYFNYTRLSDFDFDLHNTALHRDMGRLGIENFSWKGFDGQTGAPVDMPWTHGKRLDNIPWGGQDAGILVQEAGAPSTFVYKHDLVHGQGSLSKAEIESLVKDKGYKVIQVANPSKRPLKDATGVNDQIHFVVTNSLDTKPLEYQLLPYNPGGHSIYRYDHYVKQGQFEIGAGGRLNYYGDNSLMNFASEAQAIKYAEAFDAARVMRKANDPGLDAFLAKNLPYSRSDFDKMFLKGHVSEDHPIVYVKSGGSSLDLDRVKRAYPNYVDATKSEYNLYGMVDQSFHADRNAVLDTVREGNGVFQIAKAEQLDPYVALQKGLGQSIRNLWMADQKISSVQHWMEEFGTAMDPKFKTVANNPMYFLYHPQWNERVDKATLAAAKASRLSIINFLGAQSEIGGAVSHIQNKLINSIYEKFGQEASEMVADHALPMMKDPAKYARAVAFHSKLGMFNPIQLVTQAQSLAHVLAVAGPQNGLPGAAAGFIARRLLHNDTPDVLDHMANIATKFGWKNNEFKEMVTLLKGGGMGEVAGETAMRDDLMDPKMYNSTVGRWLEKGTMFFNEGERAVRLAAFATSYREWRLANPLLQVTDREMAKITGRADLLSVNMTRASSASWQQGLLSIPTQFMAFNSRLAEQFLGGRLTNAEKARAFATYSALYGVPTATAGAVGVWPFYDDIKQQALARGIDMSPAYIKALTEGLPHLMVSAITGHDYNIAQRLGPNGASIFRDAVTGDKSVMQLLGGPSGSIIGDIWSSTDPIRRAVSSAFMGNSQDFPIQPSDVKGALSTISTFALGARIHGALAYGKYITANNKTVGDMDGTDAVFAMMGLSPSKIADVQLMQKVVKGDKANQKPFETKALEQYQRALEAAKNGDDVSFRDYMKRVDAYLTAGDFNAQDRQRILAQALKYKPDQVDNIKWNMLKSSPDSQYTSRFKSFFINKDQ